MQQRTRRLFPWKRFLIIAVFLLFFGACGLVLFLATGHIIDYAWFYIIPIITLTISSIVTVLQWLMPLSPMEFGKNDAIAATNKASSISPVAAAHTSTTSVVIADADALFPPNLPLRDSADFHGRELERAKVVGRTRKGGSTSIIGPRRIGKTWLLNYVMLVAAREIGAQVSIGYMDVSAPDCATISGFVSAALKALNVHTLTTKAGKLTLATLQEVVKGVPGGVVLCLDEFESFGNHQQVFDFHFFTELRSLTSPTIGLTLITASKGPLKDLVSKQTSTSPFFNVFEQLTLKPFDKTDADNFIVSKGNKAGFSVEEQGYLRKYGSEFGAKGQQWPPLRLQLAGNILLSDKQQASLHGADYYRPNDPDYWQDFQERLEDKYRAVV